MRQQGVTLLELMIVMLIGGVIGTMAMAQYRHYVAKAQASEGASIVGGIKSQVAVTIAEQGMVAGCFLPSSSTVSGSYVLQADINYDMGTESCRLTATFRTNVHPDLAGRFIDYVYAPTSTGWTCDGSDLPTELRPSGC